MARRASSALCSSSGSTARTTSGTTALTRAVQAEYEEGARMLLERGAEAECVDAAGETPLQIALDKQAPRFVDMLLQYCTDVKGYSVAGGYGLWVAVENGNLELLLARLAPPPACPPARVANQLPQSRV